MNKNRCVADRPDGTRCDHPAGIEAVLVCQLGHRYQVFVCRPCYSDPEKICTQEGSPLRVVSAVELVWFLGVPVPGRVLV